MMPFDYSFELYYCHMTFCMLFYLFLCLWYIFALYVVTNTYAAQDTAVLNVVNLTAVKIVAPVKLLQTKTQVNADHFVWFSACHSTQLVCIVYCQYLIFLRHWSFTYCRPSEGEICRGIAVCLCFRCRCMQQGPVRHWHHSLWQESFHHWLLYGPSTAGRLLNSNPLSTRSLLGIFYL